MSELPQIDPSWTRRPRPAPKEDSFLIVIVIAALALLPALWMLRTQAELDGARRAATSRSTAIGAAARVRQREDLENARALLHYISPAQAEREIAAAAGPASNDGRIHRCVRASGDTYQLGRCRAPWIEVPEQRRYSRQDNIDEQNRMRLRADAQLRAEEQRFAALTGQQSPQWQPGYAASPANAARARCAQMKSLRDEAYRLAGNTRNFDFIRHWDDVVYQACKNA